ncbi:OmpP1/FadL family transporter [uncultured Alistipes sp.]|uniref:OmpP1/FadL family transporter n=1 Tax=uncultured Alistipes sp. TaxID=538949 RepID=UPI002624A765|nr:hypothetical protein [uncultured Alistipes sp.]
MQVKKTLISLLAVAALLPSTAAAQSSSINAFSPYSMYGIGELNTPGTLPVRSMGGAGVAMRWPTSINLLNPASFSAMERKSFLFDMGAENQNYYNAQRRDGVTRKSAYNTFNFHEIAFQLPLGKGVGLGFGLTPFSSVGYRVKSTQIDGSYGWSDYTFQGEGDITEVKAGIGWEIFRGFSVGAAAQYYWGEIDRTYIMTPTNITDNDAITATTGTDLYGVSRFKAQFGVQWTPVFNAKRMFTVGATYDLGGDLRPDVSHKVLLGDPAGTAVRDESFRGALSLPRQAALGLYYRTPKVTLALDYVYQNWRSANEGTEYATVGGYSVAYANTSTVRFGVEYIPNYSDLRRVLNRWSYRAGFRYGDYNQTFNGRRIPQFAVTAGIGIPVRFLAASAVDIGIEYGQRGRGGNMAGNAGFVKQRYFKVALGFSIFASSSSGEFWFVRPKYD